MSTIEELKNLQNFNISAAKPLTVRGQYSKNTNVDINKVVQSVSLLTTELNNINSSVQESAFNIGANFSINQWVNDAKNSLLSQLFPSIQTLIGNQNPITKKIVLTNTIVTAAAQSALNQQEILLNQLEDQVLKVVEKQNNVKVEKDKDGNAVLIPILSEQAQKSLDNVTKILTSSIVTIDKINTRIANEKPLKNINDFVNNLSLEHVIEFAEKIIAILTIALQIRVIIRKSQDIAASINSATLGDVASAAVFTANSLTYNASEQKQMQDLAAAQVTISIIKSSIQFYKIQIQSILDKLREILELIKTIQISSNIPNPNIQSLEDQLNKIIEDQQQIQDTITKKLIESEFIQINKPNYAARIIK
jgi:hypothetical protein